MSMPGRRPAPTSACVTVVVLLALWCARHQPRLAQAAVPADAAGGVAASSANTDRRAANDKPLWSTSAGQLCRVFGAFLLACVTAMPVGIAMGMSRVARGIFDPPIEFYRPLPPLAYLPLIIIWFGIDEMPQGAADLPRAASRRSRSRPRAGVRSVSQSSRSTPRTRWARARMAGDPPRDPAGGAARHPDRHAHRDRLRLDHAGRRRDGRRQRAASARWCSTRRTSCAPTSSSWASS